MSKTQLSMQDLEKRVGEEIAVSPWVEMSQERIDTFARATEDFQWIHVDPARAKESPFGSTIAHGFLTLSMLPRLTESTFDYSARKMGVNYGLNKVRFTNPVRTGRRVRGRFVLRKLEEIAGGLQMTYAVTIEIDGEDKPACIAESVVRQYFKPAFGSEGGAR